LPLHALVMGQVRHIADIVVGADEHEMVWLREEFPHGRDFGCAGTLTGPERIEADDDERVDAIENAPIQHSETAIIRHALDFRHGLACQRPGQFDEGTEIVLHNVIEKACHTLVEPRRIRQLRVSRVAHPAALEERWKPVLDNIKWRPDLAWPAPSVIENDFASGHIVYPSWLNLGFYYAGNYN